MVDCKFILNIMHSVILIFSKFKTFHMSICATEFTIALFYYESSKYW